MPRDECPRCGTEPPSSRDTCPECGEDLESESPEGILMSVVVALFGLWLVYHGILLPAYRQTVNFTVENPVLVVCGLSVVGLVVARWFQHNAQMGESGLGLGSATLSLVGGLSIVAGVVIETPPVATALELLTVGSVVGSVVVASVVARRTMYGLLVRWLLCTSVIVVIWSILFGGPPILKSQFVFGFNYQDLVFFTPLVVSGLVPAFAQIDVGERSGRSNTSGDMERL